MSLSFWKSVPQRIGIIPPWSFPAGNRQRTSCSSFVIRSNSNFKNFVNASSSTFIFSCNISIIFYTALRNKNTLFYGPSQNGDSRLWLAHTHLSIMPRQSHSQNADSRLWLAHTHVSIMPHLHTSLSSNHIPSNAILHSDWSIFDWTCHSMTAQGDLHKIWTNQRPFCVSPHTTLLPILLCITLRMLKNENKYKCYCFKPLERSYFIFNILYSSVFTF